MNYKSLLKMQKALAIIGLVIAVYLTIYHFLPVPLLCPETSTINCNAVLTSSYAIILGIPTAVYGVLFFAIELLLLFAYKKHDSKELIFFYNILGLGAVFYLLFVEFILKKICLYCTMVHIIVVALVALSFYATFEKK